MAMKVKAPNNAYMEMVDSLLEHWRHFWTSSCVELLSCPHLLLNIVVVVQRIITVRDKTSATANLSPWPLFLLATTTKMKNQTPTIKGKIVEASKDSDKIKQRRVLFKRD